MGAGHRGDGSPQWRFNAGDRNRFQKNSWTELASQCCGIALSKAAVISLSARGNADPSRRSPSKCCATTRLVEGDCAWTDADLTPSGRQTSVRPAAFFPAVASAAAFAGAFACIGSTGLAQGNATMIAIEHMTVGEPPCRLRPSRAPGKGGPARWLVAEDKTAAGGRAIEQVSTDRTDYRFPLAIHKASSARNADVSLRFKPGRGISGSGRRYRACGSPMPTTTTSCAPTRSRTTSDSTVW